jgi:hypothetical protein
MAAYQKFKLSGSTNGKLIKVTGTTSGAAVTVHTADPTLADEIVLSAYNNDTVDRELTLEWGGVTADDQIKITIPPKAGMIPVIPIEQHMFLTGSVLLKAFADSADKIYLGGCVHRITN